MKTMIVLVVVTIGIVAGVMIYNSNEAHDAAAREASERLEREMKEEGACWALRAEMTKQSISLSDQKLQLEEYGLNLDCTERGTK
jgi:hypothetical protein